MSKFVKVVGFAFDINCGFTQNKVYELHTCNDEEFAYDDFGRENYSITNCVKTEEVEYSQKIPH
ncbi:hypothetical protein [Paenibacillus sp. FSL E2-0178]|uniref:hypothetical protein n=1 Tax=Paenibacillus sp. FSL E2-0178 TaxID=2921361 RepID=UPI003157F7CF